MRYDKPFYVPIGKGKVNLHTGQRGGYYLPALEEPKLETPDAPVPQFEQPIERQKPRVIPKKYRYYL